jgi:mannose-1-phosphate guanylyltransferase
MMEYYAVIMAGGGGTRLWPLSRKDHPKQMLTIFGDQSLYQMAVARLQGVIDPEKILIVSAQDQFQALHEATPFLPEKQFILEPQPRGTASVIGLAAAIISLTHSQAVMAVLTSDHIIRNVALFHDLLRSAQHVAETGQLVTLGIHPNVPSIGYGYIHIGEPLHEVDGKKVYRVRRFVEKPDLDTARQMLASGDFTWNSGMFFWRVDVILEQFRKWMPELYGKLQSIQTAWNTPDREKVMAEVWPTIRPETIDYGIMEKAEQVAVLPAEGLGWNDVGSWSSLNEVLDSDTDNNITLAESIIKLDTTSSIIYENDRNKLVATLGIDDLIVIDTPESLLVCSRKDAQRIREIVQILKNRHLDQFL